METPLPALTPSPLLTRGTTGADALPNFTHQQITRIMSGLTLCILLAAIDMTVVVPAVPAIAADLNGFDHLSWIVSAYLLTSTAMTPIYGKLSDFYGRRAMLTTAVSLFIVTSVMCALSQSLLQLIIARGLQGIGGGGLMAMAQAVVADIVSPRERGRYQGYMSGSWAVASIFGPILGGWMTDILSWHAIFWINVPVGCGALMLSHRALRALKQTKQQARIDYLGAALLTGVVGSCLLMMTWGGSAYDWGSRQIIGLGGLSMLLLAAFVWQERRFPDPMLPPRIFVNPVIALGVITAFLAAAALLGGTFLLPLFFQLVRGADASASGSLIVPYLLLNAIGSFVSGQVTRRLGRTKVVVLSGLGTSAASFGLLATMGAQTGLAVSVVYLSCLGLGLGIAGPATVMIVQNAVERRDIGAATGSLLFLRSMGGAFGSTLVGALLIGRFTGLLMSGGVTARIDLGDLRGGGAALQQLDGSTRIVAGAALESGFHLAFLACAAMCAAGCLAGMLARDLPLQSNAPQPAE